MRTLVIHPNDPTTEMLSLVYKDKDYTVIRDCNISKEELKKQINKHDKIIFLGHGTPNGLINPENVRSFALNDLYLIDDSFAPLLKEKETLSMWCFSDRFFRKHNLKGFHTGMIISEVDEAKFMLGYSPLNKVELYENMVNLASIFGDCVEKTPEEIKSFILEKYQGDDDITIFNRKNIIVI